MLVNSVSDFIEHYCNRRFKLTTYTNEVYDGNGSDKLLLRQYPISSFTSVEERGAVTNEDSWSAIDSEKYFANLTEGMLYYANGIFKNYPRHWRCTYAAGYDYDNETIYLSNVGAGDLEYACWKLVGKVYHQRKNDPNASSESLGDYSVSLTHEAMADPEIKDILNKYKRPYQL